MKNILFFVLIIFIGHVSAQTFGNTCSNAIPICGSYSIATLPSNSSGQTPSCFASAPQQDIWLDFKITTSGLLAWTGSPIDTTSEFDFTLWNISAGCPGVEACCNYDYAGGSSAGFGMEAQTGTVSCGYNSFSLVKAKEFCPPLNVVPGQIYAIQINNYNNDNKGFTLSFANSTCQLSCTIGINNLSHAQVFNLYPNPTSDQFYIETKTTDKLNVDLFDLNGRHVFSANVSNKSNIDVTTLDNGVYTVTIKSTDSVTNKKLVIAR